MKEWTFSYPCSQPASCWKNETSQRRPKFYSQSMAFLYICISEKVLFHKENPGLEWHFLYNKLCLNSTLDSLAGTGPQRRGFRFPRSKIGRGASSQCRPNREVLKGSGKLVDVFLISWRETMFIWNRFYGCILKASRSSQFYLTRELDFGPTPRLPAPSFLLDFQPQQVKQTRTSAYRKLT